MKTVEVCQKICVQLYTSLANRQKSRDSNKIKFVHFLFLTTQQDMMHNLFTTRVELQ